MSGHRANSALPSVFWQVWQNYWKNQPEGEVPLVYIKPLMDGDFVCMAPIHHDKLKQAFIGLKDDNKFALFEHGDWAFPRQNFYGLWSSFVVSTRHQFWEAIAKFDSIHQTSSEPSNEDENRTAI
jgi:hypothetical protein